MLPVVLKRFPSSIRGTASPGPGAPPQGLLAFYWHFVSQAKGWFAAMFAASLAVALLDTVIPLFIGRLVSLMEATDRQAACAAQWPLLLGMGGLVLIVRPLVLLADIAIRHNALIPGATCLIRWQSHWHVVRQSWPFFQNDFAGRIANRVMQTANALRESAMASIRAVWYIGAYGASAYALMALADWRLGLPTLLWFCGYLLFLRYFVPRMRDLAKASSEARSLVMARVVDSYTNILTVKLFARLADEDAYVRETVDEHQGAIAAHTRLITRFMFCLTAMNAALLVSTAGTGKSTLVNLLQRFYDAEQGRICIDGQDIAHVTQESLRAAIGMVTQDTSLLHRSIAANIRYGRPSASDEDVVAAARKAQAHEFILALRDWKGHSGYEAHVRHLGGQYEKLWRHQSGGFLADDVFATEPEFELSYLDQEARPMRAE